MDREKHFRIFQDETMTRKQVLETIMKEHTEQNKIEAYEETGMGVTAHLNTIIFRHLMMSMSLNLKSDFLD